MSVLISGSELDAAGRCLYRHHAMFVRGVRRTGEPSPAVALGTAGHALLAPYYRALQAGAGHVQAAAMAEACAVFDDDETMAKALELMRLYWAVHAEDDRRWRVLEVEQPHQVDMDGFTYAWTADLLAQDRHSGEVAVIDHRLLGEPYDPWLLTVDPQLPRYTLGYRALGVPVVAGWRNMIITHRTRYKRNPLDRIVREPVDLSEARLARARVEMGLAAQKVLDRRALPPELAEHTATRSWDPFSCKFCHYRKPCAIEVRGGDAEAVWAAEFGVDETYGYVEEPAP